MPELKTKRNEQSVEAFLKGISDEKKRRDSFAILALMRKVTKAEPKMWGTSIVGFGSYQYKYKSGRGGEWFLTGFSPRKQNLTLYIMPGVQRYGELLKKLGKHKTGKGCLYVNTLDDVDLAVLEKLIRQSLKDIVIIFK
jgi:hypothetical protein